MASGSEGAASLALECMYYAKLSKRPIIFEPLNSFNNVFFDPANKQIFCLRSGGSLGVTVKGPDEKSLITFRMNDRGPVLSIRFSPGNKILGVQRSETSVEFINFSSFLDVVEYSQPCKGKNTRLIGFVWNSPTEVLYVTNNGLEVYQIIPDKRTLRLLKTISLQINWYAWQDEAEVLVVSTGPNANVLHVFQIKSQGIIIKLPKFEVDPPLPSSKNTPAEPLKQKDCVLANLYGQIYVCILKRNMWGSGKSGTEIVLYKMMRESPAKKSHVLIVDVNGRIALSIVDNLVVVHHQPSKTSFIYDIGLSGESDGFVTHHHPVVSPLPIEPCTLAAKSVPAYSNCDEDIQVPLYAPAWIVFPPNIIIDGELGLMMYLTVDPEPVVDMMTDKYRLISFLVNRSVKAQGLILRVCREMTLSGQRSQLDEFARIFNRLCEVYKESLVDDNAHSLENSSPALVPKTRYKRPVVVEQNHMYSQVFSVFIDNTKKIDHKFVVSILTEYIRSLNEHHIPVQPFIYEVMVNILVRFKCFYQLHQFIQYHVLSDSKAIACLLLSMESIYPPAFQLALDMLKRLKTANEEIIEVLLSKQHLFEALRFLRSQGQLESISARKYLEAAKMTKDQQIFYSVFKFFETRNVRMRSNPRFAPGELCEPYVKHFIQLFGPEALEPVPLT